MNDWFGSWGRGIDLLFLDPEGRISLVEMKDRSTNRSSVLRQLAQAYEGAYYLRKISPKRLPQIFEDSFRILYGAVQGRGQEIFQNPKNDVFAVHQRFFNLTNPLTVANYTDLTPSELVLTVNPGEHFPSDIESLKGLSAHEVLHELSLLKPEGDDKSHARLKEVCEENLRLPITFLEFEFRMDGVCR